MTLQEAEFETTAPMAGGEAARPRGFFGRLAAFVSGTVGAIAGITPHVLHHVGPIAGAALLAGTRGTLLFGGIGFLLTVPMLLQLRRRFGTWRAPAVALVIFVSAFTASTLWIAPAITGGESNPAVQEEHNEHHAG